jgi:hypothetical protein
MQTCQTNWKINLNTSITITTSKRKYKTEQNCILLSIWISSLHVLVLWRKFLVSNSLTAEAHTEFTAVSSSCISTELRVRVMIGSGAILRLLMVCLHAKRILCCATKFVSYYTNRKASICVVFCVNRPFRIRSRGVAGNTDWTDVT